MIPAKTTIYFCIAVLAFALLLLGFMFRKTRPRVHAAWMSAGMALDLGLVLTLELTKGAVNTVLGHALTPGQYAHVAFSSFSLALYVPVFALGLVRLRNPDAPKALRDWHRNLGYWALLFRTVGFLFMFSMLSRGQ